MTNKKIIMLGKEELKSVIGDICDSKAEIRLYKGYNDETSKQGNWYILKHINVEGGNFLTLTSNDGGRECAIYNADEKYHFPGNMKAILGREIFDFLEWDDWGIYVDSEDESFGHLREETKERIRGEVPEGKTKFLVETYGETSIENIIAAIQKYGHNEYILVDDNIKKVSLEELVLKSKKEEISARMFFFTDEAGYKELPLDEVDDFIAVGIVKKDLSLDEIVNNEKIDEYLVWHYMCEIEKGKLVA